MYPAPTHKRVDELDAKLMRLQKSTRASFSMMIPVHDILRNRFRWYYNWHMNSWASLVHWTALTGYTVAALVLLFTLVIKGPTEPILAASKQVWQTSDDWRTWQLDNLTIDSDGLRLAKKSVQGISTTKLAQTVPVEEPSTPISAPTPVSAPTPEITPVPTSSPAETNQSPTELTPTSEPSSIQDGSGSILAPTPNQTPTTEPTPTPTVAPPTTTYQTKGTATLTFDPQKGEIVDWLNSESSADLNGGSVKIELSTDGILWTTNTKTLANSDKAYLRLTLKTFEPTLTPILKNLILHYSRLPFTPKDLKASANIGILGLSQEITAGAFSDPDNDSHTASQWQITNKSGEYTSTIVDSNTDKKNLTSYTIKNDLKDGDYYFRVRYQDSTGAWSPWSGECAFTVNKVGISVVGAEQIPADKNEIITKRTQTTKTLDNKNGTNTLLSFSGLVHYKESYSDPKALWKDINSNHSIDFPDYVLYDQMPSTVKVYKNKIGYEIQSRQTGEKYTVELQSVDGNAVLSAQKSTDGLVSWADINGQDTRYKIQDTNKLADWILPHTLAEDIPAVTKDNGNLKFEFQISEYGVRLWKTIDGPDAPKNFIWKVTKTGTGDTLKFRDNPEAFEIDASGNANTDKPVKIEAKKIDGTASDFTWQETAPYSDLKIDTDVDFIPDVHDADPKKSTDGNVSREVQIINETWSDIRDGAGTNYDEDFTGIYAAKFSYINDSVGWWKLGRSILTFDTSALPDSATVSAATLKLYGISKLDDLSIAPDLNVYESNPASSNTLVNGDYSTLGTTALSTAITYTGFVTQDWNNFNLNATGLTKVDKTGVTKLGLRNANYDAANIAPTPVNGNYESYFMVASAEFASVQYSGGPMPTLSVIYGVAVDISGTCQKFDESTNCDDSETVKVAVNGVEVTGKTGTTASGAWTISGVSVGSNDVVTTWIDGVADAKEANSVTKYDGTGNITGVTLYEDHLTIGSDDNQDLSNTNLSQYDNSVSGNGNIFFDVNAGALTVDVTNQTTQDKLLILVGNTLTPGGAITTTNLDINGTLAMATNALNIAGDFDASGGAFTTAGTTTFNATSGVKTIISNAQSFQNLTIDGSGATFAPNGDLDINGNLLITAGTLKLDTYNPSITLAGNLTIGANGLVTKGSGTITLDGAVTATLADNNASKQDLPKIFVNGSAKTANVSTDFKATAIEVISGNTFGINTSTLSLTGSGQAASRPFIINSGATFNENASTVEYIPNDTTTTDIEAETYANLKVNKASTTFYAYGDITVNRVLTVQAGIFNASNKTITLSGGGTPLVVNGTFAKGTSTVKYTSNINTTVAAVDYNNLELMPLVTNYGSWIVAGAGDTTYNGTYTYSGIFEGNQYYTYNSNRYLFKLTGPDGTWILNNEVAVNPAPAYTGDNMNLVAGDWRAVMAAAPGPSLIDGNGLVPTFTISTGTLNTSGYLKAGDGTNPVIVQANTNDPNISVTGTLTVSAQATFEASSSAIFNIAGDLTQSGTFNHNSGTVNLTGAGGSTQVISGSTTFNNLSATATSARTINFASGTTQTVTGMWTATGTADQLITLGRDGGTGSNQWQITPTAWVVDYVAPANSLANVSPAIINPTHYTDGTNNTNWFPVMTIAGTCKKFDETTNCADGETVKVAYNWTLKGETATTSGGTWSIGMSTAPNSGDVITIFVSGVVDSLEANAVTKYDGSGNITGISLNEDHLTLGSDDNQNISNANISQYDISVFGNEDIFFDVSGTALTVDSTNQTAQDEILILAGNTYTPGGTVTVTNMDINGTFVPEANTISVAGSWDATGGTFTNTSSTISFTGTSGTKTITSDSEIFNNIFFNDAAGSATYQPTDAMDVNGTFILADGILDLDTSDPTLNLAGYIFLSANSSVVKGSGLVNFDGDLFYTAGDNINMGNVKIGHSPDTITLASHFTCDNLTIDSGDSLVTVGYDVTVNGDVDLNGTIDASSSSGSDPTINVAGSWDATGGTFTKGASTVNLTGVGGSTQVISGSTTFNNLSATATAARTINFSSGTTQTVTGMWTATGTVGQLITLGRDGGTGSNQWQITPTAWVVDYVAPANSLANVSPAIINPAHYTDGTNNTNWFPVMTIAGTCKKFDEATNCADGETVKVAYNGTLKGETTTTAGGAWTIEMGTAPASGDVITVFVDGVVDSLEANAVTKYDGTGDITGILLYEDHLTIGSDDNQNIYNAEISQYDNPSSGDEDIFFESATGNLVVDPFNQTTQDEILIVAGNTYTPGGMVTVTNMDINGTFAPEANTISVAGNWDATGGTFTKGASTVNLTGAGGSTQVISGTTTFNNLSATAAAARTINFASGTTQTVTGMWTVTGAAGQLITLGRAGGTGTNQWDILPTAWSVDYVAPANSHNNAAVIINPTHYTDGTNNTNWFAAMTISGTCKKFDEVTNCADSETVKVAYNGTLKGETSTTNGGTWSIGMNIAPASGNVITVFVDGVADNLEATAVTKYDGTGNITGMALYEDHLTLGSDDNQNISNANISQYDNSVSADEDVFFDVSGTALIVDNTNQTAQDEILIMAGNTYTPGGNVTVTNMDINGTFVPSTYIINIAGSWDATGGTFTSTNSTITFNATTTGNTITSDTKAFYNITFNGVGGGWTAQDDMNVAPTFTLINGTFNAPAGNLNISGTMSETGAIITNGTISKTGGTFNHNSGTISFTGSPNVYSSSISSNGIIFNNAIFASSVQFDDSNTTFAGDVTVQNNTSSSYYVLGYNRNITIKGNLNFPSTAATGAVFFDSSFYSYHLNLNLEGNLNLADSNAAMTASINFTGSGDQTLSCSATRPSDSTYSNWTAHKPSGTIIPNTNFTIPNWKVDTADYAATFQANGSNRITFTNFNQSAGITYTHPEGDFIDITNLTLSNGTFNAPAGNLNINWTISKTGGTFNHNNGTISFTDSHGVSISSNGIIFNDAIFASSVYFNDSNTTFAGNVTVQNDTSSIYYIQSGTLTLNNVTIKGDLSFPSTVAIGSVTFGNSNWSRYLNFNLEGNLSLADSNVTIYANINLTGSGDQTLLMTAGTINPTYSNWTAHKPSGVIIPNTNITIPIWKVDTTDYAAVFQANGSNRITFTNFNQSLGTYTHPEGDFVDIGTFTQSNGIFNASAGNMNTSGTFNRTGGTFNHNNGTVTLSGVGGSTQIISGTTTFNNLSATAAAARTINFASGTTQTVTGTWTVAGAADQLITLGREGGTGSDQWSINPTAWDVDYANIANSNNLASSIINPVNSVDSGNTTNWFPNPPAVASNVAIGNLTNTTFDVSWTDNASDETGYKVYISTLANANCDSATYPDIADFTLAADAELQGVDGKSINTQYCVKVVATNVYGDSTPAYSSPGYTLASVPAVPTVDTPTSSSLKVTINAASNPANTTFAIKVVEGVNTNYLKIDGTTSATPVFDTYTNFGGASGVTNTGLAPGTTYTYSVAARNGDLVETAYSTTTDGITLATYTLTYTAGANGSIVGTSPQTVVSGASGSEVVATASTGYHFVSWSDGILTSARTDLNVISDISATATFATVSITPVSSAEFSVDWTDDPAAVGGYEVYIASGVADCSTASYSETANYTLAAGTTSQLVTNTNMIPENFIDFNTQYCAKVVALTAGGPSVPIFAQPKYTFASKPTRPTVNTQTSNTLKVKINQAGNPASTEFAVKVVKGSNTRYLKTDGTLTSDSIPVWATYAAFGGASGLVNTGLVFDDDYIYSVAARNGDNVQTDYSITNIIHPPVASVTCTWDGGGSDDNWSTSQNWSNDVVPSATCDVVFNSTSNKDSIVNSSFAGQVKSLLVNTGYAGTVSLNKDLTVDGDFVLNAGVLTSNSYTLNIGGSVNMSTSPTATFNKGTGTINFNPIETDKTIQTSGQVLGDLIFNGVDNEVDPNVKTNSVILLANGTLVAGWTLLDNLNAISITASTGTLVDAGFAVTIAGNISIASQIGVLVSTGLWTQSASGNIENYHFINTFGSLTIAGAGITTTLSDNVRVGLALGSNGALTIGPGILFGNNKSIYNNFRSSDGVNVNNVVVGSKLSGFILYPLGNLSQKAITLPNNFANLVEIVKSHSYIFTATGDFDFGNNNFRINNDSAPASFLGYVDMGSYSLTCNNLTIGSDHGSIQSPVSYMAGASLKLGSGSLNLSGSLVAGRSTNIGDKLNLGSGTLNIAGNFNSNYIDFVSGTSTVSLTGETGTTQTVSGNATFNNLTAIATSTRTINFASGSTTTVTGTWTVTGADSQLITLGRDGGTGSNQWDINPTAWSIDYIDVTNSHNNAAAKINPVHFAVGNDQLAANNTNWFTEATAPTAPSAVAIGNLDTTGFDVTWNDNSSDETGFKVYISTLANANCALATYPSDSDFTLAANIELQAVTGKSANTEYCAKVVATNGVGDSSSAYSSLASTLSSGVIPSVTLSVNHDSIVEKGGTSRVTATLSNTYSQTVTVELAYAGTATNVTDYTRSGSSMSISAGQTSGYITLTAVDDYVKEDDETIIAEISSVTNGTEDGTQEETVTIIDDEPTSITNPTNFTGIAGDSRATLSWTNPSTIYFSYVEIYRSTVSGELGSKIIQTSDDTYADTGLVNDTTYYYTLKAVDIVDNVSTGTEQLGLTPTTIFDDQPPTKPTNLHATSIKSNEIGLAWDASTDDIGVVRYELYNADTNFLIATTSKISILLDKLNPETTYRFYVQAYDAAGNVSENSNTLEITTKLGNDIVGQAYFILSGVPSQVQAGQVFNHDIKIMVVDAGGAIIETYTGSIYFNSTDNKAKLNWYRNHQYTFIGEDLGTHSFSGTDFKFVTLGYQKLIVTDGQIQGSAEIRVIGGGATEIFQKAQDKVNNLFANLDTKGFSPRATTASMIIVAVISAILLAPLVFNAVLSLINIWPQFMYFITHLLQLVGIRRKRKPWGVVFNSQTGQPITYAIVKIFDKEYNRLLETVVTDSDGRFGFLVRSGRYYLNVTKNGYVFPSIMKVSKYFDEIYTGSTINIDKNEKIIVSNIPLDQKVKLSTKYKILVAAIKINKVLSAIRLVMLVVGILVSTILIILSINWFYILSLSFYVLIAIMEYFRSKRARPYGVVTDMYSRPLEMSIVRIYEKRTNRLIETDVTDVDGRFKFLVNPGVYYLTATKPEYVDFKSHIMYLEKERTMVSVNIKIKKDE